MANQISGLFQKLMRNPQVIKMANQMFNSMQPSAQTEFLNRPKMAAALKIANDGSTGVDYIPIDAENPNTAVGRLGELFAAGGPGGPGGGDLGSLALGAAKAHPFKTAGLIGSAAGNIGGLTDNDKFGGQLGGLVLGGLGAATLASGNPYLAAMMTMGGGNLGAFFDKLRARKEIEQAQGYQNAGNPIAMLGRR